MLRSSVAAGMLCTVTYQTDMQLSRGMSAGFKSVAGAAMLLPGLMSAPNGGAWAPAGMQLPPGFQPGVLPAMPRGPGRMPMAHVVRLLKLSLREVMSHSTNVVRTQSDTGHRSADAPAHPTFSHAC